MFCSLSSVQQPPAPEVLPKAQMISVLVDLELTKALVQHYSTKAAPIDQLFEENAWRVYQAHETSAASFKASLQYYLDHPKVLQEVYGAVVDQLEQLREQL